MSAPGGYPICGSRTDHGFLVSGVRVLDFTFALAPFAICFNKVRRLGWPRHGRNCRFGASRGIGAQSRRRAHCAHLLRGRRVLGRCQHRVRGRDGAGELRPDCGLRTKNSMTKRQTRFFFLGSTLLFALIFLGLTIDSHRQFAALTHADQLTEDVIAGKRVWHEKNCTNCHTLLGEGAYYAPDLTRIAEQRGAAYLHQFLKQPSTFYSEEKDRRLMPDLHLGDEQIRQLIAFLGWVSKIDTDGWPPRPLLVSGGFPGSKQAQVEKAAVSNDPVALGEALFRHSPPACSSCHSTAQGVQLVGPSLAGIATRAQATLDNPSYRGQAKTAATYVRESILEPSAFV